MDSACTNFRDTALAVDPTLASEDGHGRACAACATWLRVVQSQARALAELPRLEAPFELDGRVVAALEAGGRQQRAADSLEVLARVEPPLELERALDEEFAPAEPQLSAQQAPAVLDRLVTEELAEPAKTRARRFLGSLERMATPAELDALVAADLAGEGQLDAGPRATRSRPFARLLSGSAMAAAAALMLWLVSPTDQATETPDLDSTARYDFQIQEGSLDELPFVASGLLDGVLGGGLSVRREL